ncbi:unnamed protein product [Auanema sp. JU1783]|nr:unnamed protein product [Auanema sp. JU1783]
MNLGGFPVVLLFLIIKVEEITAVGFAEELYCGLENCYEVLDISREEFDKQKLSKSYRSLAKKYHPDRIRDPDEKVRATERFRVVATAYETLKDDEARVEYDYYLDHPEERFYNYYQYYRRKMVPKVDVRLVILGTILSISLFQYYSAKQKYSEAIAYAMTVGKFRNLAINTGVERGVLEMDTKGKLKKLKDKNNEDVIKSIIEENMDVRGGYRKESVYDTLMWHTIVLPVTIGKLAIWNGNWVWKYWVQRMELDKNDKLYLIRRNLKVSESQFLSMTEEEHEDMLAQEIWKSEKFKEWQNDKQAEEQEKLIKSGKYKRYKRYMKNNAGSISFLDEE